jgi:hypothetical protein
MNLREIGRGAVKWNELLQDWVQVLYTGVGLSY